MATNTAAAIRRYATRTVIIVAALLATFAAALAWAWQLRPAVADSGLRPQVVDAAPDSAVTATWLGVSTLLFDDGETQILIDGFVSRPTLYQIITRAPVVSDIPMIDYVMLKYDMHRLAAIVALQSHFDHAMDVGAFARRSSASVLGSESTANVARGAGVLEDQIVVAVSGESYAFGDFLVTLIASPHAPIGLRGDVPLSGSIDEPLRTPIPITAWREGGSYTAIIAHPQGTTVVTSSAGYSSGALDGIEADVVLLGVGFLGSLGRPYAEKYWQALVTTTGAKRVFPIHFEDFTQPFGKITLPPKWLEDFVTTAAWLREFRDTWDRDTQIFLPVFGEPITLYPEDSPDA